MAFKRYPIAAPGLALMLLAGCSGAELTRLNPWAEVREQSRIPADATVYACDAGKQLAIRFVEGGKSVFVVFPEREFRLDQGQGGFTNGRTTFSTRGDEVVLVEGNETLFSGCKRPAS